jgi:predicted DNA-binding transcriptional regulator AlpA
VYAWKQVYKYLLLFVDSLANNHHHLGTSKTIPVKSMSYKRKRETHGTLPKVASDRLLTPEETAILLNVALQSLAHWRVQKIGPKPIYLSRRCVRYSERTLREWLESRTQG